MKTPRAQRANLSSARRPTTRPRKPVTLPLKEEFLAMAFRFSPHPIAITELETGCCLEINDACLEIFGFRRDEVIGRTTLMLGIWPDPEERIRLIERVKTERSVRNIEVTMRRKPGDLRRFLLSAELVKLGKKRCLLTIGNDITERNRAEEALRQLNATLEQRIAERSAAFRESEERFRAFLDNAPNLAFMKAVDGRYLYANHRFVEAFGLEQQSPLDKTDAELFSRVQADQFRANDLLVLESGAAREFEELSLYRDGVHTNLVVKFPLRDESGHIYAMGGIVTDITDRKKAEDDLRHSQAFTDSVVDNLPNMVFVKNAKDLRFARLNKAGERLLGYSERELLGKNDFDIFPKTEADFFTSKDREVLAAGRLLDIPEEPIKTRDGTIRLLHTKKIPITDQEGRPLYLLGISEDITDRKQVEDRLQQQRMQLEELTTQLITAQERERQRIARELHDDVSQRMAALVLDVAAIERQPPLLAERLADMLCPLRERLEQLSDDIHNLAYNLHPSLLEHAGLRAAVEDHLRDVMNRTALTVSFMTHHVPESLLLDHSTGLFRVLQESLQNVVKHAKATEVSVRLSGSSKGVGLSITDNGTGFDAEDMGAHHKGLGLVNMRERLRLLGGFLRIHARPGHGTKVCAWLPFARETP